MSGPADPASVLGHPMKLVQRQCEIDCFETEPHTALGNLSILKQVILLFPSKIYCGLPPPDLALVKGHIGSR